MAITLRSVKGSPLTHAELDGNFNTLSNSVTDNANSINGLESGTNTLEIVTNANTSAIEDINNRLSDFSASGLVLTSNVDGSGNKSTSWTTGVTYVTTTLATDTDLDSQYVNCFGVTGTAGASTYNIRLSSMQQGQTVVVTLPAISAGGQYNITVAGTAVRYPEGEMPDWATSGTNLVVITRTNAYYASASLGHRV